MPPVDVGLLRGLILALPMVLTLVLLLIQRPSGRHLTGILLATAWQLPPLLLLNALAPQLGWWSFQATGGLWLGVPIELLVSWCFFWGALPALLPHRLPPAAVAVGALLLDLLVIPLCRPLIALEEGRWLLGEVLLIATCLMPGLVLARWTAAGRNRLGRAVLQAIGFGGIALIVLPSAILEASQQSWAPLLARPGWQLALGAQAIALCAGIGVRAAQELALRGLGTPLPQDPTQRLVVSGPYAHIANPMQTSTAGIFLVLGALLESWPVATAGLMVAVFSAGVGAWHERATLSLRFGRPWQTYRQFVRSWWPRWRPWVPLHATLYYAEGCGPCEAVAAWISARHPVGLTLVAAQDHPSRDLTRLTWRPADGVGPGPDGEEHGVAAFSRALEHMALPWALCGWLLRLPGVLGLAQLLVDASGGGPRVVTRRTS